MPSTTIIALLRPVSVPVPVIVIVLFVLSIAISTELPKTLKEFNIGNKDLPGKFVYDLTNGVKDQVYVNVSINTPGGVSDEMLSTRAPVVPL